MLELERFEEWLKQVSTEAWGAVNLRFVPHRGVFTLTSSVDPQTMDIVLAEGKDLSALRGDYAKHKRSAA